MSKTPSFTLGIEEEYLLVDAESGELAIMPEAMMAACKAELEDRVSPEYLRCQIEVGTTVCTGLPEAREQLRELRRSIAHHANDFGLAPISVACHPWADWRDQDQTDKARYDAISREMGLMARRMLICGMHVHIGIEDPDQRIQIMNQMVGFLPLLLALSGSSPYWLGEDTQMSSYRTTVFSGYPRTGFPPVFEDWQAYKSATGQLSDLGVIPDTTKIWWDIRPSAKFPTLETRVCDACPVLEDTLILTALIQATCRMLWRLNQENIGWKRVHGLILQENRWRAARYGMKEGLIGYQGNTIQTIDDLVMEWKGLIREDAETLGCDREIDALDELIARKNSAARQRRFIASARKSDTDERECQRQLVRELIFEFSADAR